MKSRDGKSKFYRHHTGHWLVRFVCEDGKRRSKVCRTKTERDALQSAIKRKEALDYWFPNQSAESKFQNAGAFNALAQRWLTYCEKVREISKSCLMNYQCHLDHHILPVLGKKFLKDLRIADIETLAAVIKDKKPRTRSYRAVRKNRMVGELFEDDDFLSTSYRREILTVACMITKFGHQRGLLASNPFAEFKLPECPEQPYDFWRLDEEDAFLNWLEGGGVFYREVGKPFSRRNGSNETFRKRFKTRGTEDLYDVVLFALRSGMRKGEIGAMTAIDVNFEENCIIVRRAYSERENVIKNTTKGKTYRVIEMNGDMRNILHKRVTKVESDSKPLFNTRTWAIKNFSAYCRKAGVREIHFHSLRHTCLTNLANGYGMDSPLPLPQVQKIAGHKDIGTTMRYVHTDGIENTASRQWSREDRKVRKAFQEGSKSKARFGHLVVMK